jgi:preprotein translocase subunit YajC
MSWLPAIVPLQAESQSSPLGMLVPMAAIFLIFYFLLIRPQQRKQKDHENLLKALGKGDRVVTSGGIHGVVTGVSEDVLTLEIANLKGERVRIKVDRGRIDRRIEKAKGEDS